ncbi:unnamed protein product [Effrenium voratum]|nr:unnamed protein product [Effrenium voratum]
MAGEQPCIENKSLVEDKTTESLLVAQRLVKASQRSARLQGFLRAHGFEDARQPRPPGWVGGKTVYPIHIAAKLGDCSLVRILLAERADPSQLDSAGRTAIEIAEEANGEGCNDMVLKVLQAHMRVAELRSPKFTISEESELPFALMNRTGAKGTSCLL